MICAEDFKAVAHAFKIENPIFIGWYEATCHIVEAKTSYKPFRSLGRTVVRNIAAHLPKDTLAGAIYLAALPFIGPIMGPDHTQLPPRTLQHRRRQSPCQNHYRLR
ncbi:hypothetical protein ARMSODRAFT_966551 [Armillaria solidipes]|uniref:Uncharacterized protein n=1 Tax=Armillaria solidipes TaxID=1076256 RepID=A0A2H3AM20_9AGAR|nr:hypothetical protein ARMSODRAFT_966551 [Armillaria solidipes]